MIPIDLRCSWFNLINHCDHSAPNLQCLGGSSPGQRRLPRKTCFGQRHRGAHASRLPVGKMSCTNKGKVGHEGYSNGQKHVVKFMVNNS